MRLAELIVKIQVERSWSLSQIGKRLVEAEQTERAETDDRRPAHHRIYNLANLDVPLRRYPEPRTVRALAAALDVPRKVVRLAIAEDLGLLDPDEIGESETLSREHVIVVTADDLTPDEVRRIVRRAQSVVDDWKESLRESRSRRTEPAPVESDV